MLCKSKHKEKLNLMATFLLLEVLHLWYWTNIGQTLDGMTSKPNQRDGTCTELIYELNLSQRLKTQTTAVYDVLDHLAIFVSYRPKFIWNVVLLSHLHVFSGQLAKTHPILSEPVLKQWWPVWLPSVTIFTACYSLIIYAIDIHDMCLWCLW